MAAVPWIQYAERVVGAGHPTLADVANRPIQQLITQSGMDPDDDDLQIQFRQPWDVYNPERYFADPTGVADSSDGLGEAWDRAQTSPNGVGLVQLGPGIFSCKNVDFLQAAEIGSNPMKAFSSFMGAGPGQTILRATTDAGPTDYILRTRATNLGSLTSAFSAGLIGNFCIEGRGRTLEHQGMIIEGTHGCYTDIHLRNINGSGIIIGQDKVCRENFFRNLLFRSCGRHSGAGGSSDAAALAFPVSIDTEGHNLLYFSNIMMVYSWFSAIQFLGDPSFAPREIYLRDLLLHGFEAGGDQQGRISEDSAVVDFNGEMDAIKLYDVTCNHAGTDDAQTGLGNPNTIFRMRDTGGGIGPDNVLIEHVYAANSDRGILYHIEKARKVFLSGDQTIQGTPSAEYVDGHLIIEPSAVSLVRLSGANNFTPSLCSVPFADAAAGLVHSVDEWEDTYIIPAQTDPADVLAETIIFHGCRTHILSLTITPAVAIVGDATNYARIIFKNRGPSQNTEIGRIETTASIAVWADQLITVTTAARLRLQATEKVTVQITKAAAGYQLPQLLITARFSPWLSAQA